MSCEGTLDHILTCSWEGAGGSATIMCTDQDHSRTNKQDISTQTVTDASRIQ